MSGILDRLMAAGVTVHEGIQKALASGVPATLAEDVAKRFGPEAIHLVAAAAATQPGAGAVAAHVIEVFGTKALGVLIDHLEAEKTAPPPHELNPVKEPASVATSDTATVSESASVSEASASAVDGSASES